MNIILHLGGNRNRATVAAKLAAKRPDSLVVISSEGGDHGLPVYLEAGIAPSRIIVDMEAWDTVTNFTHTYKLLRELGITSLTVVTDSSHMPRSLAIAEQVWGGRVPIDSAEYPQDSYKERDATHIKWDRRRAWLWRRFGVLLYWISVKEARKQYSQTRKHSLLEIGLG